MLSGCWSTSFYFGNFLGPTMAGFLVEHLGFRDAILVFQGLIALAVVVDLYEFCYGYERKRTNTNNGAVQ